MSNLNGEKIELQDFIKYVIRNIEAGELYSYNVYFYDSIEVMVLDPDTRVKTYEIEEKNCFVFVDSLIEKMKEADIICDVHTSTSFNPPHSIIIFSFKDDDHGALINVFENQLYYKYIREEN